MFNEQDIQYYIADLFMNKQIKLAITNCYTYINNNNGEVSDIFYQMLFDMLKVANNKELFQSAIEQYVKMTQRTPPDWENKNFDNLVSEKNVLVLQNPLNADSNQILFDFYKNCEETQFGRISFNHLNIAESDSIGLKILLDIMQKLKRLKNTEIILMGSEHILNFNVNSFIINNFSTKEHNLYINSLQLLKEDRLSQYQKAIKQYQIDFAQFKEKQDKLNTDLLNLKAEEERLTEDYRSISMSNRNRHQTNALIEEIEEKMVNLNNELELLLKNEPKKPQIEEKSSIERKIIENNDYLFLEDENSLENLEDIEKKHQKEMEEELEKRIKVFILLQLEVLQWNGDKKEHYKLSNYYTEKYQLLAPDYQEEYESKNRISYKNKVNKFNISGQDTTITEMSKRVITSLVTEIDSYVLEDLLNNLKLINIVSNPIIFLDLKRTNFLSYSVGIELMLFLKKEKDLGRTYDIFVKNANHLIKIILQKSGAAEYLKI